jgi:hypothetical protein
MLYTIKTNNKMSVMALLFWLKQAGVAELADVLDLGSSAYGVQVQILSPAPCFGCLAVCRGYITIFSFCIKWIYTIYIEEDSIFMKTMSQSIFYTYFTKVFYFSFGYFWYSKINTGLIG